MLKNYAKFEKLPIKEISPEGWIADFLKKQATGLTGHIEEAGYPFDSVGWDRYDIDTTKQNDNPGWWAYEQTGYHLDGLTRLSELLRDRTLRARAAKSFDYVLSHADPDGYLGPKFLKDSSGWNRWPHVVFFRALIAKYEATGDKKIPEAIARHYLEGSHRHDRARDVNNVEIMLWAYLKTGDKRLLSMAEEDFAAYNAQCEDDNCAAAQLSSKKAYAHGVTYNEYSKLGAILYICTGKRSYLTPSVKAYKKIDRYQMLPDGLHCSNEFLLDNDYMQSHETCDISDYTWALHYMLMATGDSSYGDKIEKCIFNAGIGSVEEDFKALQYFSCCNQLVLDNHSNHNDFFMGDKWMSYRPNPGTECCAGNVNRFMPNYCAHMWMKKGRGIAAVLYGPSRLTLGRGKEKIVITEHTSYPFDERIEFVFETKKERKLKFYLRLPGWCHDPQIYIGGEKVDYISKNGFAVIERIFKDGDKVTLELPAKIEIKKWGKDGQYVERGPLLYAYGMKGQRVIDESEKKQSPDFPAYNISPDRPFGYALLPCQELKLEKLPLTGNPFSIETTPYIIKAKALHLPQWKITAKKKIGAVHNLYTRPWVREYKEGRFVFTPRYPTPTTMKKGNFGEETTISLVPFGAAKVRVTVFPKLTEEIKK